MKFILFYLLFLVSFFSGIHAENKTDSLKNELKKATADTTKIRLLKDLAKESIYNDPEQVIDYTQQMIALSEKNKYEKGIAYANNILGILEYQKGNYNNALPYYNKALSIARKLKEQQLCALYLNNIGIVYNALGKKKESLLYYKKALALYRHINDLNGTARALFAIAVSLEEKNNFEEAMKKYLEAAKISDQLNDKQLTVIIYLGLGSIQYKMQNYDESLKYYSKTKQIYKELNNKYGEVHSLWGIGDNYQKKGKYREALEYLREALNLSMEINNPRNIGTSQLYISQSLYQLEDYQHSLKYAFDAITNMEKINDLENISNSLGHIGNVFIELKEYNKAIEYVNRAIKIQNDIGNPGLANMYNILYKIYKKKQDYKNALINYEFSINISDSLFNSEKHKQMAELEEKYQSDKKEQQIKLQKAELEKEKAEKKRKNLMLTGAAIVLCLIVFLTFIIYNSYRRKKKDNILLEKQKKEIEEKNDVLRGMNEEVSAQRDEIIKQRDIVTQQNKEITDSINYAQRIQKALLPSEQFMQEILDDYFIIYLPRDIVSGDFYWTTKIDNFLIVAVADCTGHGVPGAFMSMLNVAFLNDIVNRQKITSPDRILNMVRTYIMNTLKQQGDSNHTKDGMDIALINIDKQNKKINFTGANNPLWIIKNKEFTELKPDKMPVAVYEILQPFSIQEISYEPGDVLYMFSDGFVDQFGGSEGKKFKAGNLKKLLMDMSSKPLSTQKDIILKTFNEWKSHTEQVDDVVLMGIKMT